MTAKRQDITIEQGADYDKPFFLTNDDGEAEDLTGMSFAMQIRNSADDPTALLTLTSADDTLEVTEDEGIVRPLITPDMTAALLPGIYVYDLKALEANGKIRRRRSGNVYVSPQVTVLVPSATAGTPITGNNDEPITGNNDTPITS